jgi:hypothetical protein
LELLGYYDGLNAKSFGLEAILFGTNGLENYELGVLEDLSTFYEF